MRGGKETLLSRLSALRTLGNLRCEENSQPNLEEASSSLPAAVKLEEKILEQSREGEALALREVSGHRSGWQPSEKSQTAKKNYTTAKHGLPARGSVSRGAAESSALTFRGLDAGILGARGGRGAWGPTACCGCSASHGQVSLLVKQ